LPDYHYISLSFCFYQIKVLQPLLYRSVMNPEYKAASSF